MLNFDKDTAKVLAKVKLLTGFSVSTTEDLECAIINEDLPVEDIDFNKIFKWYVRNFEKGEFRDCSSNRIYYKAYDVLRKMWELNTPQFRINFALMQELYNKLIDAYPFWFYNAENMYEKLCDSYYGNFDCYHIDEHDIHIDNVDEAILTTFGIYDFEEAKRLEKVNDFLDSTGCSYYYDIAYIAEFINNATDDNIDYIVSEITEIYEFYLKYDLESYLISRLKYYDIDSSKKGLFLDNDFDNYFAMDLFD